MADMTGPITGPMDYEVRNSREFGGTSDEQTVTYHYRLPRIVGTGPGGWETFLPTFRQSGPDPNLGSVYFKGWGVRPDTEDDAYLYVSMTWTTNSTAVSIGSREDNDDLWTITVTVLEKPLETNTNYLTKWNYDLYRNKDSTASGPVWKDTDTDRSNADGTIWKWSKDSPGDEWTLFQVRTKPGVEAYYLPQATVRYQFWNSTKATVEAVLKTVATRTTPAETFGYTGAWLVTGADVDEDGTKYKGTVEYLFADAWDTDLYPTGPT